MSSARGTMVNLSVPLNPASYGPITVRTAGGVSAPITLTATLTPANATATSGTPANAALPSANPGQTITITGNGLTTATGVIGFYTGSDGTVRYVLMNPATAAADGTSATLVVPSYFNGVTQLGVIGAANPMTLQIVPKLTSYAVDGTDTLRLFGTGLQEGSAGNTVTYNFAGGTVSDTTANSGPDVYNTVSGSDSTAVYLPSEPVHGFGTVTTTTAGGTSAPMTLNEMQPADGYLRDLAMDPSNPGQMWIADNANPAKLHLVSTVTGADIRDITLTSGVLGQPDFGSTAFFGGMQIVPPTPAGQTSLSLNGVTVPAGSILLFDGQTNPDRVIAVDPSHRPDPLDADPDGELRHDRRAVRSIQRTPLHH